MARQKKQIECVKCGSCCKCFRIVLSLADVNKEPRLQKVMIPIYKILGKTRRYMAEKKLPFALPKPCPFLLSNNECSIYETRPQMCRDYPQGDSKCLQYEK